MTSTAKKSRLQQLRDRRTEASGFTLIELLIVVVILGVLAGIVVFAVSNFTGSGTQAACKSDLKNVEIAQEAKLAKGVPTPGYDSSVAQLVTDGYLREAPSSTKYTISTDATGKVTAAPSCDTLAS